LAHRAVEKTGFKFLESVAERLSSKQLMQKLSSQVLGKAGERLGERIGERAGECAAILLPRLWCIYWQCSWPS
jgi:hypothetical protein